MVVCFFGHKDTPEMIKPILEREIEHQINNGADCFLVGNQGRFDGMVLGILRKIAAKNPRYPTRLCLHICPSREIIDSVPEKPCCLRE